MWLWTKGLTVIAFFLCSGMVGRILALLGIGEEDCRAASLAFLLNPLAFFPAAIMGQYDTLCLLLLLLPKGRYAAVLRCNRNSDFI